MNGYKIMVFYKKRRRHVIIMVFNYTTHLTLLYHTPYHTHAHLHVSIYT